MREKESRERLEIENNLSEEETEFETKETIDAVSDIWLSTKYQEEGGQVLRLLSLADAHVGHNLREIFIKNSD